MQVTLVHIHVKPEHVEEFVKACIANASASSKEPGNLRFDVLQAPDDPCRIILYEAYETEEAVAAHKQTAHYFTWRDTVTDWMAEPRVGVPYKGLFP